MKRLLSSSPFAVLSLVAANVFAVYSAASVGIKPAGLILLYWLETWIITFYTIQKIKKAALPLTDIEKNWMRIQFLYKYESPEHADRGEVTRESIVRVFIRQQIAVLGVYGAILFGVLVPQVFELDGSYFARIFATFSSAAILPWLLSSALGFGISHGISYYFNFLGKKEFLNTSPVRQMFALGERLLGLHLLLMFSSIIAGYGALGPTGAIVALSFVKLIADFASHTREHLIAQALGSGKITPFPGYNLLFDKGGVFKFAVRSGKKN